MSKKIRIAFAFSSTHYAMEAENILTKAGMKPLLMPLPSTLGMGCGTAVTVEEKFEAKARSALHYNDIPIAATYAVDPSGDLWQGRYFGEICDIF